MAGSLIQILTRSAIAGLGRRFFYGSLEVIDRKTPQVIVALTRSLISCVRAKRTLEPEDRRRVKISFGVMVATIRRSAVSLSKVLDYGIDLQEATDLPRLMSTSRVPSSTTSLVGSRASSAIQRTHEQVAPPCAELELGRA